MDTCFIFVKHLTETGCLSLKINEAGALSAPAQQRSFAEIKALQEDCHTLVIETTENATLLNLELPWLADRKARVALPYALEEKLAQPLDELHFAFDKQHYHNQQYLVVVIGKQRLQYLMQLLDRHAIQFAAITLDWFALQGQELCVNDETLLINNDDFKGALSGTLALTYLKKHPTLHPLVFSNSNIALNGEIAQEPTDSYFWIGRRLSKQKVINLCQGEMQHGTTSQWIQKGYLAAATLFGVWLLSLVAVNVLSLYILNKKIAKVDADIAVIYHEYFPEAKQIISPRFRIGQLLGSQSKESQSRFWELVNQFAKAMPDSKIKIEQMRFQNKILAVTLVSPDFASLEAVENKLKQSQLKVKQTQAATREQYVIATLELS